MKKLLYIFLVSIFWVACQKEDFEPPMPTEADQTVLLYMPWSSNLTSYFHNNITDFEKAAKQNILKNSRLIVFFAETATKATMFEIKYNKGEVTRSTIQEYNVSTFTTTEGITSLINDVKKAAPANRYAMIVSCHGMGWLPVPTSKAMKARYAQEKDYWEYEGVPRTRYFGGLSRDYQINITTFADGIAGSNTKMEYILFDDCYMSSIEVAYDLKDVTDYLIASPTEVMAYGYPYADIGKYLIGNVDYYGICNGFLSFYEKYDLMPCGTIGVIDCAKLDRMVSVMKEINSRYTFNETEVNTVQRLDGYNPIIFFDFGDYVSKLCKVTELLNRFKMQYNKTVPYFMATKSYYSMSKGQVYLNEYSGVTISDISLSPKASSKTETAWYKATH